MPRMTRRHLAAAACATALALAGVVGCGQGTTGHPVKPAVAHPSPFHPRHVTVVMSGDVLLHEGLWSTARIDAARTGRGSMDFRPLLADMRPVIQGADLAICHLETPLAPPGGPFQGYPVFSAPPAIVPALKWEGYDACTTASNHSLDTGFAGLTRTLDDLHRAGIATAGTAATKAAAGQPLVLDAHGVRVGLIAATYGTNGLPLPEGKHWSVSLIDVARIKTLAARARAAGAEVVLVALHWGQEYAHAPTAYQESVAARLTRSADVDLVYGHHAHVVQPYDKVNGTWVLYGLGNSVAQQDPGIEGVFDGNTARVTFTERPDHTFGVSRLEFVPTMITHWIPGTPMRLLDVRRHPGEPGAAAALRRVRAAVGSLGAFRRGVTLGR